MKVLIVNGFSDSTAGQRNFSHFVTAIKEAFGQQHYHSVSNIEFELADQFMLTPYLSELNFGPRSRDSEKVVSIQLFDHLDFVFIDGDANMLPWLDRSRKFLALLRMCKKTKKLLFASGFAMQMLVFLCATNQHISRVVNGNGKGSPKTEFAKDTKVLRDLAFGDVFLDSRTGDVYGYDSQKKEFYPMANVGLHSHKAAQESGLF